MRYFVIVDKTSGNVESKFTWSDNRDLPEDYPLQPNQEIVVLHDEEGEYLDVLNSCYNGDTQTFETKLKVTSDVQQISHDGIANITITYPSAVNEICYFTLDGQTVPIDIVDGTATVKFSNEIFGHHLITVTSSTHYGKNEIVIEVV